ncbi:MAG: glutamate 5-kinase [Desulfonauticus sp.]|nr:glutamate 5-kinase [Desulfonauticus sp.]
MNREEFLTYKKKILAKAKRIVVKIGSAVVTTENGLDLKVITRLADDLAGLHSQGREVVLVSSGAMAAGARTLSLTGHEGFKITAKQAISAIGQSRLMHVYDETFARFSTITAQVLLTKDDLKHRERFLNARNTFFQLFKWKILPIVNENDTVAVQELKFGDNDQLAVRIVNLVEADLLINLTSAEGVFEKNPKKYPEAAKIEYIDNIFSLNLTEVCEGKSECGTGGMYSKLLSAKRAAQLGVPTVILPGKKRFVLEQLFKGEDIGTWVLPEGKKIARRKFWFAYNLDPEGEIIIDKGAGLALKKGKSLLPVGIKQVKGNFEKGALVKVITEDGLWLGVGLSNYSAREVEKIKGQKSSDLSIKLKDALYSEVIHADNLLLEVF